MIAIQIAVSGLAGVLSRYLFDRALAGFPPLSCIVVNTLGCLALGFILFNNSEIIEKFKLPLTIGFCGGLTTFSGFILNIYKFYETQNYIKMISFCIISILLGIIAFFIGLKLVK